MNAYNNAVASGNFHEWSKLLKTLLARKAKLPKKQFSAIEQKYLQTVESCVVGELSIVLKTPYEEIFEKLALEQI